MPDVFLPEAFQPLLTKSARYKGYFSGRGCAKTYTFAEAAVIKAARDGWWWLCCREHQKSIKDSVKAMLDYWIVENGMAGIFHSTAQEIACRENGGGFIFEGLANNVHGIRSKAFCNAAWVEEASTVKQSSLDILIPTIREPKSELWFSWNPRFENDPVDKLLRSPKSDDLNEFDRELAAKSGYDQWMLVQRVMPNDNPFFPEVLKAEMERDRRRDPDRYAHIWLGEYATNSEARVFRNWTVGTMEVPADAIPRYGADWGFSIDPSVLVRAYVFPEKRLIYIDNVIGRPHVEIDKTPAFFDTISDVGEEATDPMHPRRWPIKSDSSRPEVISYMQRHGYPRMEGARKGPGSVEEGVLFLQSYDILVHPRCKRMIDELTLYSFEIDEHTQEVLPTLADEDNHYIDALRYAVESLRRAIGPNVMPILVTQPKVFYGDNVGSI